MYSVFLTILQIFRTCWSAIKVGSTLVPKQSHVHFDSEIEKTKALKRFYVCSVNNSVICQILKCALFSEQTKLISAGALLSFM